MKRALPAFVERCTWMTAMTPAALACACAGLLTSAHDGARADPMRPLVLPAAASAAASSALAARPPQLPAATSLPGAREPERLVAIRHDSAQRWLALIGEQWVAAGDHVDGYTVATVDANSVRLNHGKEQRTLYLLPLLQRAAAEGARNPAADRSSSVRPAANRTSAVGPLSGSVATPLVALSNDPAPASAVAPPNPRAPALRTP